MGTIEYQKTVINGKGDANNYETYIKEQINKETLTKEQFAEYTTHY